MKLLEELTSLVSEKLEAFKTVLAIFKLETRLAVMSVVPFIISVCLILMMALSLWFSTISLIGYAVFITSDNLWIALTSIWVLNLLIFLGLLKYLLNNVKNMSFESTRACLLEEGDDDEEPERTIEIPDQKTRKKISHPSRKS